MDKDKVVADIVKKMFFEARDIEKKVQRQIKKLTALDKVMKGTYQPKPKVEQPKAVSPVVQEAPKS